MKKIWLRRGVVIIGMLAFVLMSAVPGFAQSKYRHPWEDWNYKSEPVRGGYYRTAAVMDVGLLNPNHWPVNDWLVINYMHEKLMYTDGNFHPVPWLAESWSFPNQTSCIMKLRKGVTFHDGTPFNAEAVKYQMEWIKDPKKRLLDSRLAETPQVGGSAGHLHAQVDLQRTLGRFYRHHGQCARLHALSQGVEGRPQKSTIPIRQAQAPTSWRIAAPATSSK